MKEKKTRGRVFYNDRYIDPQNFRAYVYSPEGKRHLAESWAEFEDKMASGLWFKSVHESVEIKEKKYSQKKKKG